MRRLLLLSSLFLGSLQGLAVAQGRTARQTTVFSYTFLKGLPTLTSFSATCVNDLREVAGSGRTNDVAPHRWVGLYWSSADAVPEDFEVPGALCMESGGIDNGGNIVGSYSLDPCDAFNLQCAPTGQRMHGYSRAPDGTLIYPIDVPFPGALSTKINDINSAGNMVGTYWDASCTQQAFFLSSAGVFSPISPPGSTASQAWTITDAGHIGGLMDAAPPACTAGWTLRPGGYTTVTYPSASWTSVNGISSTRNEIAGVFGTTCPFPFPPHAYLRRGSSGFIEIPPPPGSASILVAGMNELGDIVGVTLFGAGAFLGLREPRRP